MLQPAIEILNAHRTMAVSTLRPDGWPQTTIVGYANDGWNVYFLILRNSQKFANIRHDDRISFAVASEAVELNTHKAVYVGAHAVEMTGEEERERGWRLLVDRHPNLVGFERPDPNVTALMRARCEHVSVLDYSIALGHTEALTVQADGTVTAIKPSEGEKWRPTPA
ncbi:pyridoxamine 5'-phosphate oxidase family protein [Sphingomonas edaphi]|uniref:Pyridoxamine 5'-phosphate oxidase n=1 Tax=Sphingomonas edaphi TaxID=2315689 RepID=A0A418Q0W1_9SPHN|nr:pyridoxamine 5'-phosphate oxidase family protein [Sphingomonas edaphi]RIX31481.1 pyridoxamine 5'-phosphate oxidase [Sphingomonas edaphi]